MQAKTFTQILFPAFFLLLLVQVNAQCDEDKDYWTESWQSCTKTENPNAARGESYWILYEFNEPIGLAETQIWNANRQGESDKGANEVYIDISKDGISWQQVGNDAFIWEQAPETDDYEGFAGPDLTDYGFVQKVLITIESTHGDTCASIAEVKFNVNPNACAGLVDVCGVCDGDGMITFYLDADNDGQGNENTFIQSCEETIEGYVKNNQDNCDTGGWDQMASLFNTVGCTGCHNQSAQGGLNLLTYEGFLNGGDKCGTNIHTGNTLVNIIQIQGYDECGEVIEGLSMNSRVGDALDELDIAAIQAWIDAGAPEDAECQRLASSFTNDDDTADSGDGDDGNMDNGDDSTDDDNQDDPNIDDDLDDTTGEEQEQEEEKELTRRIYPNPSDGLFYISGLVDEVAVYAQVHDFGGKVVKTTYRDGEIIESIDLQELPFGTYIVMVYFKLPNSEALHEEVFKIVKN